jgi:hypothetical protein
MTEMRILMIGVILRLGVYIDLEEKVKDLKDINFLR